MSSYPTNRVYLLVRGDSTGATVAVYRRKHHRDEVYASLVANGDAAKFGIFTTDEQIIDNPEGRH